MLKFLIPLLFLVQAEVDSLLEKKEEEENVLKKSK